MGKFSPITNAASEICWIMVRAHVVTWTGRTWSIYSSIALPVLTLGLNYIVYRALSRPDWRNGENGYSRTPIIPEPIQGVISLISVLIVVTSIKFRCLGIEWFLIIPFQVITKSALVALNLLMRLCKVLLLLLVLIPELLDWLLGLFQALSNWKLNTDGSSKGNPGQAGFGGVFREERGHWVLGFFGRLTACTSLEAELWGIPQGLEMVKNHATEVESDSEAVVLMVNVDFGMFTIMKN